MEICFVSNRLKKACSESREGDRIWGEQNARKIRQRLVELRAAETLADVSALPPARCHELKGDLAAHLAVDVHHPFRMIVKATAEPPPSKADGGLDWTAVDSVTIVDIVDYHP